MDDFGNCLILIAMYALQGAVIGLVSTTFPIILKKTFSFKEISLFNLAAYPYSLKFFWSPFVDSYFSNWVGKRKTWIIPVQIIAGVFMIFISGEIESMLIEGKIYQLTISMFFLYLLYATQDIAVDSWAIELLSKENKSFASTTQTIGHSIGIFISCSIFLSLNSPDFCNKFIFQIPQPKGILSLSSYFFIWGTINLLITFLISFKKENPCEERLKVLKIYKNISKLSKLPNYQNLLILIMTCRVFTAFTDFGLSLALSEKGFKQSDFALTSALLFPFELFTNFFTGLHLKKSRNMFKQLVFALKLKLLSSLSGLVLFLMFSSKNSDHFYLILANNLFSSLANSFLQAPLISVFGFVADPTMTSTSFTFLMTAFNFAGSTSRFLVFQAIYYLNFSVFCDEIGKNCVFQFHGFVVVGVFSLAFGVAFIWRMREEIVRFDEVPKEDWWVEGKKID
jgi:hypothetical protein